jgi:isopentenyldiphosphate isomerase
MSHAITYLDRIAECNNADLRRYRPWYAQGAVAGFLRDDRYLAHSRNPAWEAWNGSLQIRGEDFASRSAAMAAMFAELVANGLCRQRNECYAVGRGFADAALLQIDRGGVPFFGVRPYGVHLTGYVRKQGRIHAWVGVRARDKPTYPGMWDNTVAGGQPIGLGLRANLIKECAEEAGMPADLAAQATQTSTLTYVREDDAGLKPDTLFCFDLELPLHFVPQPNDGEVEEFLLLPIEEIAAVVRDTQRCKPNCNLVWIDFCMRHGVLDGELTQDQQQRLAAALRSPLP